MWWNGPVSVLLLGSLELLDVWYIMAKDWSSMIVKRTSEFEFVAIFDDSAADIDHSIL